MIRKGTAFTPVLERFQADTWYRSCQSESKLQDWCMHKFTVSSLNDALDHRGLVEIAVSIDDLVTSRSITRRTDFADDDLLDAKIASALKKLYHEYELPTKSVYRRASTSKVRPILTRKANSLCDLRAFSCNRSVWCGTRSIWSVQCALAKRWRSGFRYKMGPSSIISKWSTYRNGPWKDCTSQNYKILFSFRQHWLCMNKKNSKQRTAELFQIEDCGKTSYWSANEDTQFQSLERNRWKRSSYQEAQRGEKPSWRGKWENAISGK